MNDSCRKFLEDPEANASHLAECAECRALADSLQTEDSPLAPPASVDVNTLPLASWEGASYRSWPLIAAGVVSVAVIAVVVFAATGFSPLDIVRGRVPSSEVMASIVRLAGGAVKSAPVAWQVGIAVSFLIVNAIFIALLRRAPRGLDV